MSPFLFIRIRMRVFISNKRTSGILSPAARLPRIQFLTSLSSADDIEPDKTGFERFVTGTKEKLRRLDKPYGIASQKGKIYVCDTNATVMVFDLEKNKYGPLAGAQGLGVLTQPLNISVDGAGNKYVSDPIRGQVIMYDRNDFYVKAFGTPDWWKPVNAAAFEDMLYVADSKNGEVKVVEIKSGTLVRSLGNKAEIRVPWQCRRISLLTAKGISTFQMPAGSRSSNWTGTATSGGSPER